MDIKSFNILIGCTGSVATIKIPLLAEKLTKLGHKIIIVPTNNALHFLKTEAKANDRSISNVCCKHLNNPQDGYMPYSTESKLEKICNECEVRTYYSEFEFATDTEEWTKWNKRGDSVRHIELREWADLLVVAPLDANTLAKVAQGLCDNLLTCIIRAWNMNKPLFFCPAMNTQMYIHPFTSQHIKILKDLGFEEIEAYQKSDLW
ncbi:Phosphopantothenoylcysteine decarboxylase [Armadillidium vulgare]|nr:Phosphopantothenoylcysteine decarboxylase [Armadillidium vulgare]